MSRSIRLLWTVLALVGLMMLAACGEGEDVTGGAEDCPPAAVGEAGGSGEDTLGGPDDPGVQDELTDEAGDNEELLGEQTTEEPSLGTGEEEALGTGEEGLGAEEEQDALVGNEDC
ncbi:MAG: hypothetical protein KatS3mg057_1628 [Herpetosiphonaceae bacterium]|nr:MAG: hypothetical protein KatS3mg057_1628 [Herpetosiphonaceae bacterium]